MIEESQKSLARTGDSQRGFECNLKITYITIKGKTNISIFDVELRLSLRLVRGNIGSTDATKTCHILNASIFKTNNRKVINNTLDSL
jgi:hypothetical protein